MILCNSISNFWINNNKKKKKIIYHFIDKSIKTSIDWEWLQCKTDLQTQKTNFGTELQYQRLPNVQYIILYL